MQAPSQTIFYGALINPVDLNKYDAFPRALLCVASGEILWIEEDVVDSMVQETLLNRGCVIDGGDVELITLKKGEFLMPGFIDTHTHAPQVPNLGSGAQYELLTWLEKITFPMEKRFADVDIARKAYRQVVRRIIDSGTTTCCYYGSLHLEATKILADIVHEFGQRAFVGKCNMDRNALDYIEPSVETSVSTTQDLIKHIRSLSSDPSTSSPSPRALVHPILTPRFAISCTPELLTELGKLADSDPSLAIQTHISENKSEIEFTTQELFPWRKSYADVYRHYKLLRGNTILAHAVWLTKDEMDLVKEAEAGVSHCPTSNFNLTSGMCKVGELLDRGIKVGLGTDASGGFSPSILRTIQDASVTSGMVSFQYDHSHSHHPDKHGHPHQRNHEHTHHHSSSSPEPVFAGKKLRIPTLLYLATLGGAEVCNLKSHIGSFAPGRLFDALHVSVRSEAGNPGVWSPDIDEATGIGDRGQTPKEQLEAMLESFMFCGDDRNIAKVYVQGRAIGGRSFTNLKS